MDICDIMVASVPTVSQHASVREAVHLLNSSGLSGLPVVDDRGLLVGMITEHDVVKAVMPSYHEVISDEATRPDFGHLLESRAKQVRDQPVSEIMVRNAITIAADDPLIKAASTMLVKRIKILPVVKDGRPIGIVSRISLVNGLIG